MKAYYKATVEGPVHLIEYHSLHDKDIGFGPHKRFFNKNEATPYLLGFWQRSWTGNWKLFLGDIYLLDPSWEKTTTVYGLYRTEDDKYLLHFSYLRCGKEVENRLFVEMTPHNAVKWFAHYMPRVELPSDLYALAFPTND